MEPNGKPSTPLDTLGLAARYHACLRRRGVRSVEHLCLFSEVELLASQSWGETTLHEVRERLAERGLSLRADQP